MNNQCAVRTIIIRSEGKTLEGPCFVEADFDVTSLEAGSKYFDKHNRGLLSFSSAIKKVSSTGYKFKYPDILVVNFFTSQGYRLKSSTKFDDGLIYFMEKTMSN